METTAISALSREALQSHLAARLKKVMSYTYVPHDLVHNLRDLHRMARRASTVGANRHVVVRRGRIGDMAHVVHAVRGLAVPAGRERDDGAYPTRTHLVGQRLAVRGAQLMLLLSPVAGMQRWHTLRALFGPRDVASPTNIRKPGLKAVTFSLAVGDGM